SGGCASAASNTAGTCHTASAAACAATAASATPAPRVQLGGSRGAHPSTSSGASTTISTMGWVMGAAKLWRAAPSSAANAPMKATMASRRGIVRGGTFSLSAAELAAGVRPAQLHQLLLDGFAAGRGIGVVLSRFNDGFLLVFRQFLDPFDVALVEPLAQL